MTQVTAPPRESSAAFAALIALLSASYSRGVLVEERSLIHIGHLLRSLLVGTPSQFLINLLPGNILDQLQQFLANNILSIIKWQPDLSDTTDKSNNLNTKALFQVFLSNSTSSDSSDSFSC
jgi:hypothetical protein